MLWALRALCAEPWVICCEANGGAAGMARAPWGAALVPLPGCRHELAGGGGRWRRCGRILRGGGARCPGGCSPMGAAGSAFGGGVLVKERGECEGEGLGE